MKETTMNRKGRKAGEAKLWEIAAGNLVVEKMKDPDWVDLKKESFGSAALSRQEALGNCVLIDVSGWVQREMGFCEPRYRASVAVSIRVWQALHGMPELVTRFYSATSRGNDLLTVAAYALRKARRLGYSWCNCSMMMPTKDCCCDEKMFRVEATQHDDGRPAVTISFADEG